MAAERMRFAEEPDTEVSFFGSPGRESVSGSERTNLPDPVEAGVDYDDVRVDYRLATRLRDRGRRRRAGRARTQKGEQEQERNG